MHNEIKSDMEELTSAEEFLEYFEISFEPSVVQINRLHILQRFHDYMEATDTTKLEGHDVFQRYRTLLTQAYQDFVGSDAKTEKVFKVFKMMQPQQVVVPLSDLLEGGLDATTKV